MRRKRKNLGLQGWPGRGLSGHLVNKDDRDSVLGLNASTWASALESILDPHHQVHRAGSHWSRRVQPWTGCEGQAASRLGRSGQAVCHPPPSSSGSCQSPAPETEKKWPKSTRTPDACGKSRAQPPTLVAQNLPDTKGKNTPGNGKRSTLRGVEGVAC